jgi:23S rRNA (cytosine1962-C5)-methyltransferase
MGRDGLVVSPAAESAIRRGHPWVYREQLRGALDRLEPGAIAKIISAEGSVVGRAIVDPGSPIAARIWSLGDGAFGPNEIRERILRAIVLRDRLFDEGTDAYRLVHGEGDRAPGIVVDRYGPVAVLRFDGPAVAVHRELVADALFEALAPRGVRSVVLRQADKGLLEQGAAKIAQLRGEPAPERLVVREHGVPFVVDLARGQKTGAFLDQRDNRRRVGALARGRRVLNLFSYTGGFSLHAALGGAAKTTSVDVAGGAHATAQASFAEAGVDPAAHAFVTADVFQFLERAKARGERWDLVISDPPNMAPSAATRVRALTSYRRLHAMATAVLSPGGVLCAASCSSHVGLEDFLSTLTDDVLGRSDLRIVEIAGPGRDHPVLPAFPEGRYLEFCVLAGTA